MTSITDLLDDDFGNLPGLGELADRVSTVLERQRQALMASPSAWAVRPIASGAGCTWWLIADDSEGERRGREVITAFFGPGLVARVARPPGSDVPAVLAGHPRTLMLERVGELDAFVTALELMTSVCSSAPELHRDLPDPVSYLLRDFYLAIDQRDSRLSDQLLSRIENTGLVGSENLRFLRVERLAGLGYWSELAGIAWFEDLARARRPLRITEHLLQAVWRSEFDESAIAANPGAAASQFDSAEVVERFGSLIRALDVPDSALGRRLAALFAHRTGDAARVERILAGAPDEEHAFLEVLCGRSAPAVPADVRTPLDRARDLFEDGDYDSVVSLAEADVTPVMTALAVRAAFELNDPRLAQRAARLCEEVGRAALPTAPGFKRIHEAVLRLAENLCGDWLEWLGRVAVEERWSDAAEVARDLSPGWDTEVLESTQGATTAADALLRAADGVNGREVRACLDLLCSTARTLAPRPAADAFVDAVLLALSSDKNPSVLVRSAFFELFVVVLDSGPTSVRYRDLLATTEALWQRVRGRDAVPWLLDTLDVLAARPSPEAAARSALVTEIVRTLWDFADRMPLDERRFLEDIAAECDTPVSLPPIMAGESAGSDVWAGLSGKLIGLYSLLDGVGERFRTRLARLARDVRIIHNSDTVATDALRTLASTADYLIVDTRHASHSATAAIDGERSRSRQLFPSGGGLSSFIARLRDALEEEQ